MLSPTIGALCFHSTGLADPFCAIVAICGSVDEFRSFYAVPAQCSAMWLTSCLACLAPRAAGLQPERLPGQLLGCRDDEGDASFCSALLIAQTKQALLLPLGPVLAAEQVPFAFLGGAAKE